MGSHSAPGPELPRPTSHRELFRARLSIGTTVVLASNAIFVLADLALGASDLIAIWACKFLQIAIAIWVRWRIRRPISVRGMEVLGIIMSVTILTMTAASGVVSNDPYTTPILSVALLLATAGIMPWRPWAQATVSVAAAATTSWYQYVMGTGFGYGLVAVVSCGVCSVLIVHLLEKRRRETETSEQRARSGEQVQSQISHSLVEGSREIIEGLDDEDLLPRAADIVRRHLEAEFVIALVPDPVHGAVIPVAQSGLGTANWAKYGGKSVHGTIARLLAADIPGEEVNLSVLRRTGEHFEVISPKDSGLSVVLIRLSVQGEVAGYLTAWRRPDKPHFGEKEHRIAEGLAPLFSAVLQNRQLLNQLEKTRRWQYNFLASMSHELRTPLNVILGYSEMLLDESRAPELETDRQLYGRIYESARTQLQLVNEALEISRSDSAGLLVVRDEPILPESLIEDLVREAQVRSDPDRVRISGGTPEDFRSFRGDPVKLRMILTNLVDNAIKFTHEGEIRIEAEQNSEDISFSVSDTGVGINDELKPNLFDAFRPGDRTDPRGLGIGLFIVKRLVDTLHGRIELSSTLGEGSRFTVIFPRYPEDAAQGQRRQP